MLFHVLPIDDTRKHEVGDSCWCKPDIEKGEKYDTAKHYASSEQAKQWVIAKLSEDGNPLYWGQSSSGSSDTAAPSLN